jgi:NADPH-dependent ferric siderophore reductase
MRQVHVATVTARGRVTPRMVRLTLAGADLVGLHVRPAQDLEILLTDDGGHDIKRHYTIRHTRPLAGECDLDILIHDDGGPGSRWAATARVGERVRFVGPRGKMQLRAADWYLFVGDEASLPAIAALTEALDPEATTYVLAEVGADSDRVPVTATHLTWITRPGVAPGTCGPLAAALADLDRPAGTGQAYLLGESRVMNTLRDQLARRGVSPENTFVKGYWNTDLRHPQV